MEKYKLRFISLGGVVGVTKNMHLYELYKDNKLQDILIVDCGIGFPTEKELGIDFVIPDIFYLKDKVDKIRGVVLSHGHEDHISALPYHYQALGRPPVLTSKLTKVLLENKFKEFNQRVNINEVDCKKVYRFGEFQVEFIRVTHSIPDTLHMIIKTPVGNIYHGTDFKFDLTPPYGPPPDFHAITKAGKEGILALMSDCLGAEREGLTLSEKIVGVTFEDEIRSTKGVFIMTTFSSNISRIRQCVEAAIKFNRKICFLGRSMKENTKLAAQIGYLTIPHSLSVDEKDLARIPPNKICLIVAGSQGQYDSALSKLSRDQNPYFKIKAGDKITFSSDPIPGNEVEVYNLIEELILKGAEVIYPDITDQLHASGHANQEDLKFLARFVNPKYFVPIGGTVRHQRQYQRLISDLGFDKNSVFTLDEGETVWFYKGGRANKPAFAPSSPEWLRRPSEATAGKGELIETKNVYVDAYGIGDVGNIVLRDRKTLASDGMVIAILAVDNQGMLISSPKILSRGFVFEKEEGVLYKKAIQSIEGMMKPKRERHINLLNLKREVINKLENVFFEERGRKPIVVVEIIKI